MRSSKLQRDSPYGARCWDGFTPFGATKLPLLTELGGRAGCVFRSSIERVPPMVVVFSFAMLRRDVLWVASVVWSQGSTVKSAAPNGAWERGCALRGYKVAAPSGARCWGGFYPFGATKLPPLLGL